MTYINKMFAAVLDAHTNGVFSQTFYRIEADELFPAGCKCGSTNSGGDCDWCQVYYNGIGEAHGGTDTE